MLKRIAVFLITLLVAAPMAFAQMGTPAVNEADAALLKGNAWVEGIQAKGVLRVGFDTFRPWAMKAKNGSFVGFEIAVAEALSADMGVKPEFVPTAWDGIIPALLTGNFDIIIGSMSITEERAKRVAFTDPYNYSGMAICASRQSAPNLSTVDDFNKKEMIIVVKSGTTAVQVAKELFPQATIREFDDESQTAQELRSGRAQALVASSPYPAELALNNPNEIYVPISGMLTKEPNGMGLNPKDKEALPALNAWIAARHQSDWLEKTWVYWFETLDWEPLLQ